MRLFAFGSPLSVRLGIGAPLQSLVADTTTTASGGEPVGDIDEAG